MDIIAHCRAAVKEPGSAFFIKKRAVFCQEPPRHSGPRERAGFHGIPSLRWNKWQSSYKSNDTSFNIDCLPTWQSSTDWQTTYFASWAQVCHLGKVRFTALVRWYFGTWPDNLRGSGVVTERACRCQQKNLKYSYFYKKQFAQFYKSIQQVSETKKYFLQKYFSWL